MNILSYGKDVLSKKYGTNTPSFKCAYSMLNSFLRRCNWIKTTNDFEENGEKLYNVIISENNSKETKRKLLLIFIFLLKNLDSKWLSLFLQNYSRLKKEIIEERKTNSIRSEKEMNCLQYSLFELRKKYPVNINRLDQKSLLFNLFLHIDETPRLAYRTLVFNPEKNKQNYIELNKEKVNIILNDYKTYKFYKTWVIEVTHEPLRRYLHEYVKKMKPDEYFFLNRRRKIFPSNKFSEFVQQVFLEKIGIKVNVNCLRKLKERELFHKNPNTMDMSLKDKEQFVEKYFKHTLKNAELYYNRPQSAIVSTLEPELAPKDTASLTNPKPAPKRKKKIKSFRKDLQKLMSDYNVSKKQVNQLLSNQVLI